MLCLIGDHPFCLPVGDGDRAAVRARGIYDKGGKARRGADRLQITGRPSDASEQQQYV